MTTHARIRHFIAALAAGGLAHGALAQEVTTQRLVNADKEPRNWLLPYGTYDARNHSSLREINRTNVARLRVQFMHSVGGMNTATPTGAPPTFQATPVVNEGVMYVHNGWGQVLKVDLRNGRQGKTLWINDPKIDRKSTRLNSSH